MKCGENAYYCFWLRFGLYLLPLVRLLFAVLKYKKILLTIHVKYLPDILAIAQEVIKLLTSHFI